MKTRFFFSALLPALLSLTLSAQDLSSSRSGFLSAGTLHMKGFASDSELVRGPLFSVGSRTVREKSSITTVNDAEFGLGFTSNRNRQDLSLMLKPVDLIVGYNLPLGPARIAVGPAFLLEYDSRFMRDYPGAFDSWQAELSFGLAVLASFPVGNSFIDIKLRNSISGLVCRNEIYHDDLTYDIFPLRFLRDIHQNGRTLNPGNYNRTCFEVQFTPSSQSAISFAYGADFVRFRGNPESGKFSQSVRIYINAR